MASYAVRKSGDTATVTLRGNATVNQIRDIASAFRKAFGKADTIKIRADGIEETDMSFYQLLWSAQRMAARHGKTMFVQCSRKDLISRGKELGFLLHNDCEGRRSRDSFRMADDHDEVTVDG